MPNPKSSLIRKIGYVQLAPSVGISYLAIVLQRFKQGRCLRGIQWVTLLVALEGLLEALVSEKRGTREMKTEDMNGKENILV